MRETSVPAFGRSAAAAARPQAGPRVAVVVPVFKHPVLVVEAIESALALEARFGIDVVIVNDGCPFPETDRACRDYADAYPDRIHYLKRKNGGLSEARNTGIRYVLEAMPTVEAIYMLDADNTVRTPTVARGMAELDAHPDVDWIYPNVDMFGMAEGTDFGGPFSRLMIYGLNYCEAGSLIRRRVFEAGLRFDGSFKLGWEDWDFFMSAAEAGFTGRNCEFLGFRYRKRPESMLANSERDRAAIAAAMNQKHKKHLVPRKLVALEQEESPRFALLLSDRGEVVLATDPAAPGAKRISLDAFEEMLFSAAVTPSRAAAPPMIVATSSTVIEGLEAAGLLRWALWTIETGLASTHGASIAFATTDEDRIVVERPEARAAHLGAAIFAIKRELIDASLKDETSGWLDTLATTWPEPSMTNVTVSLPKEIGPGLRVDGPSPAHDFLALYHRLRRSTMRASIFARADWREPGIGLRPAPHEVARRALKASPVYPHVPDGRRHVGFLLPLIEFGGVEKVALGMAAGLKARGFVPHLFVMGATDVTFSAAWRAVFESIDILQDSDFSLWHGDGTEYLGTTVPTWAASGRHDRVIGWMHWLDAVINLHVSSAAGVMGQLRRLGVKTVQSLHLSDLTTHRRPVGNTYLGLAYEHAYDLFAPCSLQLGAWLHAMGVPGDKIVAVQNAPGFESDAAALEEAQAERATRDPEEPLRVLFLGRLDPQKGIDRLAAMMSEISARGIDIDWRIHGKSVVAEGQSVVPEDLLAIVKPPLSTPEQLTAAYGWADVVLLPSRFEGLPLTILEAMRAGVVPVATAVGAVTEVLHDGENGLLIGDTDAVADGVAALERLAGDRDLLRRLSARAYADRHGYDWVAATRDLAAALLVRDPNDPRG